MSDTISTSLSCRKCGGELSPNARFCSKCGTRVGVQKPRLSPKNLGLLLLITLSLWGFGWFTADHLAGPPPQEAFQHRGIDRTKVSSQEIEDLRAALKSKPDNVSTMNELAAALRQNLRTATEAEEAIPLVMELLETLIQLSDHEPDNPDHPLEIAELSFQNQTFDKSVKYYRRYLELRPDDVNVASRLASALTFTGQIDEALQLLQDLLKRDPENFQARAYLAIAYAQKGDLEKSIQEGEQALRYVPNDAAKERFSRFLESVRRKGSNPDTQSSLADSVKALPQPVQEIVQAVGEHPIAGPRLRGANLSDRRLRLLFVQFPIAKMPANVRQMFLEKVRTMAPQEASEHIEAIDLVDQEAGEVMRSVDLTSE